MTNEANASDAEMFASNPEQQMPETVKVEPKVEQPETGADAQAKAAKPEATPETEQHPKPQEMEAGSDEKSGMVPSWRLREQTEAARAAARDLESERTSRMAMERRVAELEAAASRKPAPDRYADPEAYEAYREQMTMQAGAQMRAEIAETRAIAMFGSKAVEEAMAAAIKAEEANPSIGRMIGASPNPWAAAVEWHRTQRVVAEVGNDPAAYKERVRQEAISSLKADPQFRQELIAEMRKQAGGESPAITKPVPPSLNGVAGAKVVSHSGSPAQSEEELFMS